MSNDKKKTTGTLKSISFDKNNRNAMIFHFEDGSSNFMAIPPGRNRTDILTEEKLQCLYNFDFKGLIIITQEDRRLIYLESKLIFEQML